MTEDTKQFIIKFLVICGVISALYFVFSPYQNCMRSSGESPAYCDATTSW